MMRNKDEMMELILNTAQEDDRIRAVVMNGSRVNPNIEPDIFQDFDIVYLVTDMAPFVKNEAWIARFGEMMIMQMPDAMDRPEATSFEHFAYLMQFADGNRIDLSLIPYAKREKLNEDSLTIVLLDKDGQIPDFPPPSEATYVPRPPTAVAYHNAVNEFWWVATYVAKGLWRQEVAYAQETMHIIRKQLLKMLDWYVGTKTDFAINPGKLGKNYAQYLTPAQWQMFLHSYAGADETGMWDALLTMAQLFRHVAVAVAEVFDFAYAHEDDARVWAHLQHVQKLSRGASTIY